MKLSYLSKWFIPTLTSLLLTIHALLSYSESHATDRPIKADVIKIGNGELYWLDDESGGFNRVANRNVTLDARGNGLEVPKARTGIGDTIAHLEFFSTTKKLPPLVQVRPISDKAIYRFPCRGRRGEFIYAWKIEVTTSETEKPACPLIVAGKIQLNSQYHPSQNAQAFQNNKSRIKITANSGTRYSQNFTSPSSIFISPVGSGVIVVHTIVSDENITVNALVGDVSVQVEQSSEFILNQGSSYSSSSGSIQPIDSANIPSSSIEAFLDPNNWSSSVAPQIEELKQQPSLAQWQNPPPPLIRSPLPQDEIFTLPPSPTPTPPILR